VFDEEYTLEEDTQISIDIYATHSYGYNVFINIINEPEFGTLEITGGGEGNDMSMLQVLYIPNINYYGNDSFTYNAMHNEYISEEAIISLTINSFNDAPFIDSIEPAFGGFGSTIIINGSNFSPNDVDNTVFFGGLEADILNATENALMVTVPYGAYYTPISVYTNGLYAVSNQHFDVIFDAAEGLTTSHLSNQLDNPFLGAKYYDVKIADLN